MRNLNIDARECGGPSILKVTIRTIPFGIIRKTWISIWPSPLFHLAAAHSDVTLLGSQNNGAHPALPGSRKMCWMRLNTWNKERGPKLFWIVDDNINVNRNHAMQIFSGIIERGLDIQISLSSGIHLASTDEDLIRLMGDAGLAMIKLPIEHGNDYFATKLLVKN